MLKIIYTIIQSLNVEVDHAIILAPYIEGKMEMFT